MTENQPQYQRALFRTAGLLALLAYVPALTASPGRMPADSKLYLYLNPARFLGDAASSFDPRQFAGWVPHQHISYLWPAGPWYWVFDLVGAPDWIAHRLWIGTLMLAAGLGVRWCARLLGLSPLAAATAAIVFQLSLYILPYVSRTSVMLLPWAGLGWIVAFTIRATRRQTWGDPAAIALIVLTVGAVNATALLMIVPAPVLWLVHTTWQRSIGWRQALMVAVRVGLLSIGVSIWWVAMLLIQARAGADVLPYSESLGDVSFTSSAPEVWRSLGYWLFYIRDPYAAATSESLRYLTSTVSIVVSFVLPVLCLSGLVFVRWAHRRFAALLVAAGFILAVGVHPIDDASPLMRLLTSNEDGGLALALRSSTRAVPVLTLGLALAVGSLVAASADLRLPRLRVQANYLVAGLAICLALVNLPSLWTGAFVDPALERDQDPPTAWVDASEALDDRGSDARVLQLPGVEFGAFRWGYTVDQPLPGLTEKPLVTRDLLPLGSPAAMDLLFALDDRSQDGVLEPGSVAPISILLGVDTIWATNDLAYERFRTTRPEVSNDILTRAPGIGAPESFGPPTVNDPDVPMIDERSLGDPNVGQALPTVDLFPVVDDTTIIRARESTVVVSGSGAGLVDLAAAGLLPAEAAIRYSADNPTSLRDAGALLVTDSNRNQARHWRSSQDTTGFTESGGPNGGVLRDVASDQRLPLFDTDDPNTQTVAVQTGPVVASATSYGEPFAYLPEHRPYMAVDGDPNTAWSVGEHGDPVGEMIRLTLSESTESIDLTQTHRAGNRRIASVDIVAQGPSGMKIFATVDLDDRSIGEGQPFEFPTPVNSIDITIASVGGGEPLTASAVSAVGFSEIETGLGPTVEVVRPPHDALESAPDSLPLAISLTRLRTDPMDRWRDDPEPQMIREFSLPTARTFAIDPTVRLDLRASDAELAALFDWPVTASNRLLGAPLHSGVSAFDGDPTTTWISEFGDVLGTILVVEGGSEPIDEVTIDQPPGDFSSITSVVISQGGESRSAELRPDSSGSATAIVDPPFPAGDLIIQVVGVDAQYTLDRRFADLVQLPVAVSEINFPGRPSVAPVVDSTTTLGCVPLLDIDGTAHDLNITIGRDALLGEPVESTPCETELALGADTHRLQSVLTTLPLNIDRIVLNDAVVSNGATAAPAVNVVESSKFARIVEVDACPTGCWLVFGEGFNEEWQATGPTGSLGTPVLVDGGFNGWWIEPTLLPTTIEIHWPAQRSLWIALGLSLAAALLAIFLLVKDLRMGSDTPVRRSAPQPMFITELPVATASGTIGLGFSWAVLSALLIGPWWALCALVGGVAMFVVRRQRIAELTALASVIVVGAAVTVIERRDSPLPNGGWPDHFDSLHGVGMFAVVSLLAGAIFAPDASGLTERVVSGGESGR